MDIEKNVSGFIASISREAEKRRKKIADETERIINRQLSDAEDEALRSSYDYIKRETAKINSEYGHEFSAKSSEIYKDVFLKRSEIVTSVFSRAKEKLIQFTKTDEYKNYLKNSLEKVYKEIGNSCIVFANKQDIPLLKQIDGNLNIKEENFTIGGIKVVASDGKLLCDDTLDTKLEAQKSWFYENSGLFIKN